MRLNVVIETEKPWGRELLLAENSFYAMKEITVKQGARTSLQSHVEKVESVLVVEGEMILEFGPDMDSLESVGLGPGDAYSLVAGEIHRVTGVTEVRYVEASSPHLDDVVRHEDDYGRR
jgi:mannose-6-phosphate isomerase-like protein (cupin superfamily)